MNRTATAQWNGTGKEGSGNLSTQSSVLSNIAYTHASRFVDENTNGKTNPEELIAAAHAGCFSMKLAFVLNAKQFTADSIKTTCEITLADGTISKSHLTVSAKVPGISKEAFDECVDEAKTNCPVSKLLKAEITVDASLNS